MGHQNRDEAAGRRTGTARRLAVLRQTTALRALTLVGLLAAGVAATDRVAWADGGQGGEGGAGGMDNPTGAGGTGGTGGFDDGGGGGGSGLTGGNGGAGGTVPADPSSGTPANPGNPGGAGGGTPGNSGKNGLNGADETNGATSGGGGGGGAHGTVSAALPTTAAQGGNGGDGGSAILNGMVTSGSGGGGGGGGYGAVVTGNAGGTLGVTATGGNGGYAGSGGNGVAVAGSGGVGLYFTSGAAGSNVTIGARVTGGTGGNGDPAGDTMNGSGGPGGVGIVGSGVNLTVSPGFTVQGGTGGTAFYGGDGGVGISGSGLTIVNNGQIEGGAGGPGSAGNTGPGGVGIVGSNLTINNTANGRITGGMSGDGMTQAYAIQLTGGTNYVANGGALVTFAGGINVMGGASLQPGLPGSPVGQVLTVNGPIAFAPGSYYNVRITPTAADNIIGDRSATLTGATVRVIAGYGTYAARSYPILSANAGLGGTRFAGVISNFAFLTPTLSYDTFDVVLNIQAGTASAPAVIAANGTPVPDYRSAAATENQYSVASGLTNAGIANGGTGPILTAFDQLTVPQAQAAFDSISGEGIAAAQNTAFGSTSLFISSIFDQTTFYGGDGGSANQITLTVPQPGFSALAPDGGGFTRTPIHELADLPSRVAPIPAPVFVPQRTWRAWATGFGGVEDFSGNAFPVGSAGQSDTIYGGTLGIDYQLMPNYLAGLAIGGSNGDFSVPGRGTSGSTTGGHVAFYDLATSGAFYAASTTSASFYSNQTTRTIAGFGGLGGETERGNFRSDAYSSKVEFGRHFAAYGGLITPFASIELTDLRSYGFTETALSGPGLFALNVQGQDTASVPSLVGARFQTLLPLGNGLALSPSLQVAWEHQFSPQRPVLAGLINLPGAVFLTNGASPARDSAAVKAGGELAISKQAALFANFDGDFSGVDRFYGGKGGFEYVW